jgi:ketopantoate hydroxymethyltransferase
VMHDVLGLYPEAPPFAKRYANLADVATSALTAYAADVRGGAFPAAPAVCAQPTDAARVAEEADVPLYS